MYLNLGIIALDIVKENRLEGGKGEMGDQIGDGWLQEFRQKRLWSGLVVAVAIWEGDGQV